jgi:hypothetical protein
MRSNVFFAFFLLFSCNTNTKKLIPVEKQDIIIATRNFYPAIKSALENKTQTITLEYIVWGCACANWITKADLKKYEAAGSLSDHCIFIEPSDSALQIPENVDFLSNNLKLTGNFYTEKGYPREYLKTEEEVESARVFRYTKYIIVKKD